MSTDKKLEGTKCILRKVASLPAPSYHAVNAIKISTQQQSKGYHVITLLQQPIDFDSLLQLWLKKRPAFVFRANDFQNPSIQTNIIKDKM